MRRGPRGEKRPSEVVGAAITVARIATDEIEGNPTPAEKTHHSRGGKKDGSARTKGLSAVLRPAIAKEATAKRWGSGK